MAKRSEVRKRTPKGLTDKQKKMLRAVIGGAIPPVGAVMLIQNLIKKRDDRPGKGPGPGPKKKIAKAKIDRETAPFKRKQKNIEANKQVRSIKEAKAATREAGRGGVMPKRTNVLRDKKGKIVKDKKGKPIKTGRGTAAFKKRMEERKRSGGK